MLTITELNVRADQHVRNANDANQYGWMREDARLTRVSKLRAGLSALVGTVRRPAAPVAGVPADRSVLAPAIAQRGTV